MTLYLNISFNVFPLKLQGNLDIERKPYIYINKDGNPSTISTTHVEANVNTQEENQNDQNNSDEIEILMLKMHPLPQIN